MKYKLKLLVLTAAAFVQALSFSAKAQDNGIEFIIPADCFWENYTDTIDPVTVKGLAFSSGLYLAYGGFNVTVSSTGANITCIELETADGTIAANVTAGSLDASSLTWTGSTSSVTFSAATSGDQLITRIVVYLEGGQAGSREITINDGDTYEATRVKKYDKVTYTRNFTHTGWQALYVPFAIDCDAWKDDYEFARIYNFIDYDDNNDGTFDRTYLVVQKLTSGSTEPNMPYLIRSKKEGAHSMELTDCTLQPKASNSVNCRSVDYVYTFHGTYTGITDMQSAGYYALVDGALCSTDKPNVHLHPQRWYMDITSRHSTPSTRPQSIRIVVDGEDSVEGIKAPATLNGETSNPLAVDLTGRCIQGHAKGVSIVNGKKVIR